MPPLTYAASARRASELDARLRAYALLIEQADFMVTRSFSAALVLLEEHQPVLARLARKLRVPQKVMRAWKKGLIPPDNAETCRRIVRIGIRLARRASRVKMGQVFSFSTGKRVAELSA